MVLAIIKQDEKSDILGKLFEAAEATYPKHLHIDTPETFFYFCGVVSRLTVFDALGSAEPITIRSKEHTSDSPDPHQLAQVQADISSNSNSSSRSSRRNYVPLDPARRIPWLSVSQSVVNLPHPHPHEMPNETKLCRIAVSLFSDDSTYIFHLTSPWLCVSIVWLSCCLFLCGQFTGVVSLPYYKRKP